MKNLVSLILFVFFAHTVHAQWRWNVKVGANYSMLSYSGDQEDSYKSSYRLGYQFGVGANYSFDKYFSLRPAFNFIVKGAKSRFYSPVLEETERVTPMYLELPIMAAYNIKLDDELKLVISGGPYIAYGIGGEYKASGIRKSEGHISTYDMKSDFFGKVTDDPTDLDPITNDRFDWGLSAGFSLESEHFLIGFYGAWGLQNHAVNRFEYVKFKHVTYGLSVGYIF